MTTATLDEATKEATLDEALALVRKLHLAERARLIEIIAHEMQQEHGNLDEQCNQALALGQDPDIVQQVREGNAHPAMLAYGLLKDDESFARLQHEIEQSRRVWKGPVVEEP